jgi:limonene-1,2-epoxide hydrolase
MNTIVESFCGYYKEFSQESIAGLDGLYHHNVVFVDPTGKVEGLSRVKNHFSKMMSNVTYCNFEITDVVSTDTQAFITWTMTFAHPKLNHHQEISVPGVSSIMFNERITYHRDYFDVGCMFYEQVPVLKQVIVFLKKRLSS